MEELDDYTGELRPDATYHDLSKGALERLLLAAVKELLLANGVSKNIITRRWGYQAGVEYDAEFWATMAKHEIRMTKEALKIPGNDLVTFLKCMQFMASTGPSGPLYQWSYEFEGPGRMVVTIKKCPALDYYEKNRDQKAIADLCNVVEPAAGRAYCDAVNPAIRLTPLKLPPRESPEDVACRWLYELEIG